MTAIFMPPGQPEGLPLPGKPGRIDEARERVAARNFLMVLYTLADTCHLDVERSSDGRQNDPPDDEGTAS